MTKTFVKESPAGKPGVPGVVLSQVLESLSDRHKQRELLHSAVFETWNWEQAIRQGPTWNKINELRLKKYEAGHLPSDMIADTFCLGKSKFEKSRGAAESCYLFCITNREKLGCQR